MNATILEYAGFLAWYSERTSDGDGGAGSGAGTARVLLAIRNLSASRTCQVSALLENLPESSFFLWISIG